MAYPHRRIRLIPSLVAAFACVAAPIFGEEAKQPDRAPVAEPSTGLVIHPGRGHYLEADGLTAVYPDGFLARIGDATVIADAVRYAVRDQELFAQGRVVYAAPGLRVHADRLGLRIGERRGQAWDVEAWIEAPSGRLPVRARHLRFDRNKAVFTGVQAGPAHGGLLAVGARSITVRLRDRPDPDREGPGRFVRSVSLGGPYLKVMGAPVLWLPWLYRDFVIDYPWTRYRFGRSERLGWFAQAQIGSSLPELLGWHTRVEGRFDRYSIAGTGLGANVEWRHRTFGRGEYTWYGMDPEEIRSDADADVVLAERDAEVHDAEHRVRFPGGAAYARWVDIPDGDPLVPGGPSQPPDERFRANYLRDDLEHRPFARRGATLAEGTALGTFVVDTERRANDRIDAADRLLGVQATLPATALLPPLHVRGDGWVERLRRDATDSEATRATWDAGLLAVRWFGGLGLDAGGGARGLAYGDGTNLGVESTDEGRFAPYLDGGVRLRWQGRIGALTHVVTPRLGVELLGRGHGDVLTAYDFGDGRDRFVEDQRYVVASIDTTLSGQRQFLRATALARFAMREEDRSEALVGGGTVTAENRLVEVVASIHGSPHHTFRINGDATYDARSEEWGEVDLSVHWQILRRVTLVYDASHLPVTVVPAAGSWQHRPGIELDGNRYQLGGDVTFRSGGDAIDRWSTTITRHMVEGDVGVTYEESRSADGGLYDRRISLGVSVR